MFQLSLCLALTLAIGPKLATPPVQEPTPEELALLDEVLAEAERDRLHGQFSAASRALEELLAEQPQHRAARALRARIAADQARWNEALEIHGKLLQETASQRAPERDRWLGEAASWLLMLGRSEQAQALLAPERLDSTLVRNHWIQGEVAWARGDRSAARTAWKLGTECRALDWQEGLYRARCWRRLGALGPASEALVAADEAAKADGGSQADVLAELASLYFEADREVAEGSRRSAGALYEEALRLHPTHEGASLGLYELYRYNWLRQRRSAAEILQRYLEERPQSIEGRLRALSADLSDGNLPRVRSRLLELQRDAPGRREVRALAAALAWVEHRREEAQALLKQLFEENQSDSLPQRWVAEHLCDLYRFAEALPFARRASEIDPEDYQAFLVLGKALANTGDESAGLAALDKAAALAEPRADAWRDNTRLVLKRMQSELTRTSDGELTFAWDPKAAEVLATYLVPFYQQTRTELAQRYGFTPGKTAIEVFHEHADFSVRSTGFEGFPALGVCFGPVVTAVSPLAEMRGSFSWARTSFHEFSHVVHLGLSNNRCPRWITEGIATWEETNRNPSWSRNMRRELYDARANGRLIPTRELNAAFRTQRILFAYYQGGLLCEMWVKSHGFPALVHMLEAFNKGLDLDATFRQVLNQSPEQVDALFRAYVDQLLAGIRIEPRWEDEHALKLFYELPPRAPKEPEALARWCENWITVGAQAWQSGRKVDSEEALRRVAPYEKQHPRAVFLRAEMALAAGDTGLAMLLYQEALDAGGEDFRARMARAKVLQGEERWEASLAEAQAAERVFPGYADKALNAEFLQFQLHQQLDQEDLAMQALSRWLDFESGDYDNRLVVAQWHMSHQRPDQAAQRLAQANEIDPFRRKLHVRWAQALEAAQRWQEAEREYGVALMVPPELDADEPGALGEKERQELEAALERMRSAGQAK